MSTESAIAAPVGTVLSRSTPYPWPFHGAFDPERTVLVACLDGWWRPAGPAADAADARLASVGRALRRAGGRAVAIASCPPRRRTLAGVGGAVRWPIEPDWVVTAGATSGFYASPLQEQLVDRAGRLDLLLAGWGLEGPVHSTLRAANDRGFECLLLADASAPIEQALAASAVSMVAFSGGIFGAVGASKDLIELLGGDPAAPSTA